MIIFAKICKSNNYKGFVLLFVHPAKTENRQKWGYKDYCLREKEKRRDKKKESKLLSFE